MIYPYRLIGSHTEIVSSTDPTLVGRGGDILDETKNMLIIEDREKRYMIPKSACAFSFSDLTVNGHDLIYRPEERIKRYMRGRCRGW